MCGSDARDREPTPPLAGLELVALAEDDLDQVLEIERASFGRPWRREHFLHEIRENRWAVNQVARRGERVHGYSCVWRLHGELRINNFAVRAESRRLGLARWMLRRDLDYETARQRFAPFDRLAAEDPPSRRELAQLVRAASSRDQPALVIVNNKAEGSAPLSIERLAAELVGSD